MRLVVYGTLRRGEALSQYLPKHRGTYEVIELSGLQLYVLGSCPGAKLSTGGDKVTVELWEFIFTKEEEKAFLQFLDRVEGVSAGLYKRSYTNTPKGMALIYTVCGNVRRYPRIKNWIRWQRKSQQERYRILKEARVKTYYTI